MWYVITNGPMKTLKDDKSETTPDREPIMIEKPRYEWTAEDKKKENLDNIAMDILYKTLDKNMFSKITQCTSKENLGENHSTVRWKRTNQREQIDSFHPEVRGSQNEDWRDYD